MSDPRPPEDFESSEELSPAPVALAEVEGDLPGESPDEAASEGAAWRELESLLALDDPEAVLTFMRLLPHADTAYTVSHLSPDSRTRLMGLLTEQDVVFAADLLEHLDDGLAADIVGELPSERAAELVEEMDSDEQADVLAVLSEPRAEAILEAMPEPAAQEVRERLAFAPDTAGGLMITEYLAYPDTMDAKSVRADLRANRDKHGAFEVRYLYTIDQAGLLIGVVPMRELVVALPGEPLQKSSVAAPLSVSASTDLDDLEHLFDRVNFSAVPVVDDAGKLLGVVQRAAVEEALGEESREDLAKFGGIIRGQELRTMPSWSRAARRLAFLAPVALLTLVSASLVAAFEPTVAAMPILAAFLPVVAGICGSGGTQALAVSIREQALGLITMEDLLRVMGKEVAVGAISGVFLGAMMMGIIGLWRGSWPLAIAVGAAIPFAIVIAKCVGGCVPVLLRALRVDPAMASGPLVTTVADLASFLSTLGFAYLAMRWSGGVG
ncbi:MAG: magnesium transporter [Planctomycetota bacterium]